MEDDVGQLIERLHAELRRIATSASDAWMLEKFTTLSAADEGEQGEESNGFLYDRQLLNNLVIFMEIRVASLAVSQDLCDCVRALAHELTHRFDVYELSEALESQLLRAAQEAVERGDDDQGVAGDGDGSAQDQDHDQRQGQEQDYGQGFDHSGRAGDVESEASAATASGDDGGDSNHEQDEEEQQHGQEVPRRSISSHEGGLEAEHVMLRVESEHEEEEEEDGSGMRELVAATDDVLSSRRELAKVRPIDEVMVPSGVHEQLPSTTGAMGEEAATSSITTSDASSSAGLNDLSFPTRALLESVESGGGSVPYWWTSKESDQKLQDALYELSASQTTYVFHQVFPLQSTSPAWAAVLRRLSLAIFDAVESGRDELFHLIDEVVPFLVNESTARRTLDRKWVQSAKRDVQIVGKLFNQGLHKRLPGCIQAGSMLDRMEVSGIAPSDFAIARCGCVGELELALRFLSADQLMALEDALPRVIVSSSNLQMTQFAWRCVQQIAVLRDKEEKAKAAAATMRVRRGTDPFLALRQRIGAKLADALRQSKTVAKHTSSGLQQEIDRMRKVGTALSPAVQRELRGFCIRVVVYHDASFVTQLRTLVKDAADAGIDDCKSLRDKFIFAMILKETMDSTNTGRLKRWGNWTHELHQLGAYRAPPAILHAFAKAERWSKAPHDHEDPSLLKQASTAKLPDDPEWNFLARWRKRITALFSNATFTRLVLLYNYVQSSSLIFSHLFDFENKLKVPIMQLVHFLFGWGFQWFSFSYFFQVSSSTAAKTLSVMSVVAFFVFLVVYMFLAVADWLYFGVTDAKQVDRVGHAAVTWSKLAQAQKSRKQLKKFGYLLAAVQFVHFPITQFGLETTLSKKSMVVAAFGGDDGSKSTVVVLRVLSWFFLILFSITYPIFIYWKIKANSLKPGQDGMVFDIDGRPVKLVGHVFTRLVTRHPNHINCPYKSLYQGYEQRMSYWSVWLMVQRLVLLIPIVTASDVGTRNAWVFSLSTVFFPINIVNGLIGIHVGRFENQIGMVVSLATWLSTSCALIASGDAPSVGLQWIIGLLVFLVNLVAFVLQVVGLCLATPVLLLHLKNYLGEFTFSDKDRDIEQAPLDEISPSWNFENETLYRIWQPFWKSLLIHKCSPEATQRLTDLEVIAMEKGREQIEQHWVSQHSSDTIVTSAVRAHLEGVDVYVDELVPGATEGDPPTQVAGFAKLVVQPYPFECKISWDDAKTKVLSVTEPARLASILTLNLSNDVVRRRTLRRQVRSMAGKSIHLPLERKETMTVDDGEEVTVDEHGKSHAKPRHSDVEFTCHYTMGTVTLYGEANDLMAPGFRVVISYSDGRGEAIAPTTKQVFLVENRPPTTVGIEHLGLTNAMDFIGTKWNDVVCAQFGETIQRMGDDVRRQQYAYRRKLANERIEANSALGDAFWYMVYADPTITRATLEGYLTRSETNQVLRDLPETHSNELDVLYWRMTFVLSRPSRRVWYIFWDDFFTCNSTMEVVKCRRKDFDPMTPTSICYRVLPIKELLAWLTERGLLRLPANKRWPLYFTEIELRIYLYERMENPTFVYRELSFREYVADLWQRVRIE